MTAPNDDGNPWISVRNLLVAKVSVATLATAIEQHGIQTYDRFGRRVVAQKEGKDSGLEKRILDCLASYCAEVLAACEARPFQAESDPDRWFDYDSPFENFGWPADEAPKFDEIADEIRPNSLKLKKLAADSPVHPRTNRSFLVIIAALCQRANLDYRARGSSQRIRESTEQLGRALDDDTILGILKAIPEALEDPRK